MLCLRPGPKAVTIVTGGLLCLGNVRNPTIPPLRMLSTSLYTREAHSYLPYRSISRIVIGNGWKNCNKMDLFAQMSNPKAPSGRELSAKATEGERDTTNKRFSLTWAPSVSPRLTPSSRRKAFFVLSKPCYPSSATNTHKNCNKYKKSLCKHLVIWEILLYNTVNQF